LKTSSIGPLTEKARHLAIIIGRRQMAILIISLLSIIFAVIIHIYHGLGCWGFQPGGKFMAMIFDIQAMVSMVAIFLSIITLAKNKNVKNTAYLLEAVSKVICFSL